MSLKYKFSLRLIRLLPVRNIMESPPEKQQKIFNLAYKGENIPELHDNTLNICRFKINGFSVLYYRHKKATGRLVINLVGGGMLKYPKVSLAKKNNCTFKGKECRCNAAILSDCLYR